MRSESRGRVGPRTSDVRESVVHMMSLMNYRVGASSRALSGAISKGLEGDTAPPSVLWVSRNTPHEAQPDFVRGRISLPRSESFPAWV